LRFLLKEVKIRPSDLFIGIDGGTSLWFEIGKVPHFAVGDWDSLKKKELLSRIPHVTLSVDKDRSDLFFAVIAAIEAGAQEIVCLGVTGGRPDHHFASLADLTEFSTGKRGLLKSIQAKGVEGDYFFISEKIPSWSAQYPVDTTVSIFAVGQPALGVTLSGFRYLLKQAKLEPSSRGLSNQVAGRKCEVRLRKGQLLVIMPRNGFLG
jgi:thiamine pyrophosphokinase